MPRPAVEYITLADATVALRQAQDNMDSAHEALRCAQRTFKAAEAHEAEGADLARLALTDNNATARGLLTEQVRALHPGVVDYLPQPTSNSGHLDSHYFSMEELCLIVDVPDHASDEFVAGLADALRQFVHEYQPKINSPKTMRQGRARAVTPAGDIFYRTRDKKVSDFVPVPGTTGDAPEVQGTLFDLLMDVPNQKFLAGLRGATLQERRTTT